ncbi:MAG: thiamine pyrophosphate-binding protein [Dehalococcoidia bacterium]|nr:thiamine pyrophosphate-binding protein [Dehalococcoidia bacterium]
MAELNGGQIVARQLKQAGIDTAFGVVAGPMIEVMAGMQQEGIKVINCRHELNACFMASAWGYINKKPGIVVAGSGPAVTNCVTGMYVATDSGMPLVVLGGSTQSRNTGWGGFQEADQVAYAKPGCKWTATVNNQDRIPEFLHLAMGKAMSGRPGAVYLDFPGQVIGRRMEEDAVELRGAIPEPSAPYPGPPQHRPRRRHARRGREAPGTHRQGSCLGRRHGAAHRAGQPRHPVHLLAHGPRRHPR